MVHFGYHLVVKQKIESFWEKYMGLACKFSPKETGGVYIAKLLFPYLK